MKKKQTPQQAKLLDELERFLWLHPGALQEWHLDEEEVRAALREAAKQEERFDGLEKELWEAEDKLARIRDYAW